MDPALICVWCQLRKINPTLAPQHNCDDDIPVTPCANCWLGLHEACRPDPPYWCACACNLGKDD